MEIEIGDFYNAGIYAVARCRIAFICGKELNWLKGELSSLKVALEKIDFIIGFSMTEMLTKAVVILMEEPATLSSDIMDQYDRGTDEAYQPPEQSCFNYHKLVLLNPVRRIRSSAGDGF